MSCECLFFNVSWFVLYWYFILVLVVMFVLGIIFVYSFSGFGFWCFDVEFLTFLRSHVVLAHCLIVLSFRWLAIIFVVGYIYYGMNVSKIAFLVMVWYFIF
jgi:hypothetical protein